jgi:predicted dehydrogenase
MSQCRSFLTPHPEQAMFDGNGISRRSFLKQTGASLFAASAFPAFVPSSAFGAADRVNLAIVGVRGQGSGHLSGFGRLPDVRIHTIVDVDGNVAAKRAKEIQERFGYTPKVVTDMRRAFDDPEVHAATFAVPNHWHALAGIWAVQAGKHAYVEKPASHGIWEGRQLVNAARKYNKLIQIGFQNRSRRNTTAAIKLLHDGGIGKVFMARGLCHKQRGNIGRYPDGPMAPGEKFGFTLGTVDPSLTYTADYLSRVDYDLWTGPAQLRPFNRNRFHYNWHWNWEYGNGDTGNQGPHQFDVARWGLNKHEYPVRVASMGGYYAYTNSDQNTPNTQTSIFHYEDGTQFEFTTRGLQTNPEGKVQIGVIFYGSEGRLEMDDGGNWWTYMGPKSEPGPDSSKIQEEASDARVTVGQGSGGHYGNFINAVRTGKQSDLTCDVEEGHRSSVLAHMANISYRVGRELQFDGKTERFVGEDSEDANKLLKRDYRKGFEVPDLTGSYTSTSSR